jgi:hypothetical protein
MGEAKYSLKGASVPPRVNTPRRGARGKWLPDPDRKPDPWHRTKFLKARIHEGARGWVDRLLAWSKGEGLPFAEADLLYKGLCELAEDLGFREAPPPLRRPAPEAPDAEGADARTHRIQARLTVGGRKWFDGLVAHVAGKHRGKGTPPAEADVIWMAVGRMARASGYPPPQPPLRPDHS